MVANARSLEFSRVGPTRRAAAIVCCALAWLLTACVSPAPGHSGKVAVARPMDPITVDGDLSDWPEESTRYPITLAEYGVRPSGPEDFQAFFRVGHGADEDSLYVAIEVTDDSTVTDDRSPTTWNSQDGCELYLDLAHDDQSSATQYAIRGGKELAASSGSQDVAYAVRRDGNAHVYEWRLSLAEIDPRWRRSGRGLTVGFDVVVCDKDSDGSFSWMAWSPGTAKWLNVNGRGDLVLAPSPTAIGAIAGHVRWEQSGAGVAATTVRIESIDFPRLSARIGTGAQGAYAAEFPEGPYRLVSEVGRKSVDPKLVSIGRGATAEHDFVVPSAQGRRVQAGSGRFVESAVAIPRRGANGLGLPDGLVRGGVRAILQDRGGAIWLATAGGASRYDGMRFRTFTTEDGLPDNDVRTVFEDSRGVLWIGTRGGLTRFADSEFTNFTVEDGLASNRVYAIAEDRLGRLWIATRGGGVSRFDGAEFTTFTTADGLASNDVAAIAEDDAGSLWFGTIGAGASRFDGARFESFTIQDGLASNNVATIVVDREGVPWFWTSGGVSRYESGRFSTPTIEEGFLQERVLAIVTDHHGIMWLVTEGGVARYDGARFETFLQFDESLSGNAITSLAVDRELGLWVATRDGDVTRHGGLDFTPVLAEDGSIDGSVNAIFEDRDGTVWLGTSNGVYRFDVSRVSAFAPERFRPNRVIATITQDRRGALWFAVRPVGVVRFDGADFVTFTTEDGLPNKQINCIFEDRAGILWFGTWNGGVSRFDGRKFTTLTTADGLANNTVHEIFEDKHGSMWFATSGGVSRRDGSGFTNYHFRDGLAHDDVRCITEDADGTLWFGTWRGVSRYDGARFSTLGIQDGLAGNHVHSIMQDNEGILWIATDAGLSRYDGHAIQNLYVSDGLPSNNVVSLHGDRNGDLWIGTANAGATRFRPHRSPPPVFIEEVTADRPHGPVGDIALASSQEFLQFDFHGISFKTRPEAMLFRYRLLGHEDDWRTTNARRVTYRDLPRGEYAFEVQAIDRDLSYSETPARVAVRVHPPYGRIALWSALALSVTIATWLATQVVRRNRNLRRSNAALARRTEELQSSQQELVRKERLATLGQLTATVSHELRNPLGTIRGSCFLIGRQCRSKGLGIDNALDRADRSIDRCDRIIDELLSFSRVRELDLTNGSIDAWLNEFLDEHEIPPEITVRRELASERTVAFDRELLRRVLVNVVDNARDAMMDSDGQREDKVLAVRTESSNDRVLVWITDTGSGIAPDKLEKIFEPLYSTKGFGVGLGLPIVRQIMRQHGGDIEFASQPGQGSVVTLWLPLVNDGPQRGEQREAELVEEPTGHPG